MAEDEKLKKLREAEAEEEVREQMAVKEPADVFRDKESPLYEAIEENT